MIQPEVLSSWLQKLKETNEDQSRQSLVKCRLIEKKQKCREEGREANIWSLRRRMRSYDIIVTTCPKIFQLNKFSFRNVRMDTKLI